MNNFNVEKIIIIVKRSLVYKKFFFFNIIFVILNIKNREVINFLIRLLLG